MDKTEVIRVVLADDHTVVRKGIRDFLEEEDDIQVVAEATTGAEAVALTLEHRPEVAVLDIQMPEMTGIEAARQIKAKIPEVQVLVLTAYDDDPYIFAMLQAGASGYVLKNAPSEELIRAVRTVAAGGSALDPTVTAKVMAQLSSGKPLGAQAVIEKLTQRELDVLRLAARGHTNRAIGLELGISDRTVQGHLANIFGKLGVATRTEAVLLAMKQGWITLDEAVE
ncbi:MAG: response regulator transcription factor [Anaerolineae bacterium]|nr:response regulator transcription factor [Anaerolineae bacterium]